MPHCRLRRASLLLVVALPLLAPPLATAQTSSDAFLKLLQILRDRGSITASEYDELRLAAGAPSPVRLPEPASDPAVPPLTAPVATTAPAGERPGPATAGPTTAGPTTAVPAQTLTAAATAADGRAQKAAADGAKADVAGKWYERIGFRGYTQFRMTDTYAGEGVPVEVPSDRSVNENETLMIRRGRFILSGDLSDHFALYAQSDFNASTGAPDFSLQMRDLYADIAFDKAKTFRVRLGQSKVPYGFVNMQSSQNRGPLERPDALNSAVEGERDLGAYMMWAPAKTRQLFRDLVNKGLKGSGDYGVVAVGVFGGQGLNRPDQNGALHWLGRATYPFTFGNRQILELGVQGYTGRFVVPTQSSTIAGVVVTPARPADGQLDERVGVTAVWYPQPIGFEAEWNFGTGPVLADDGKTIETDALQGGYLQLHYRRSGPRGTWFPFTRWQYYDGGRKFARNAPRNKVNEIDFGLEFARWADVELTAMYTHTFERRRTSSYPYAPARNGERVGIQVQWNY